FMKREGWVANLSPAGGSFDITPGNFQNLIHFGLRTAYDGAQGAVITEYDASSQTFTLGGY
ncbi:MAG: hypothetical protein F6K39_19485, partial [Okeania sp. SIO3B3]|nr:hypothetical protein [Okeania sp. SIO3B3]